MTGQTTHSSRTAVETTTIPADETPLHRHLLYQSMKAFTGGIARLAFRLKVRGVENIPTTGGVLIVSNHQSFIDPIVLGVMVPRPLTYLADAYLFKVKAFGWFIRSLNAFPIKTGRGDVGAMKETIRHLQSGKLLNIFPEGMRSPDGTLQPVLAGASLAIRRAKVPVVPAIIVGAYQAWPRHKKLPRLGKVRVIFRPPVRLDHLDSKAIVATLEATFREMFQEARAWRDEAAELNYTDVVRER